MSRNVEYDLRALRDQETLLAALAEVGYGPDKVEVHAEPVQMFGIGGSARSNVAHIVIRRANTGIDASNDIGFRRNADGTYTAIVSDYDSHALNAIMPGRVSLLEAVQAAYGRINANKTLKWLLTKKIPSMKARGEVPRNATIQQMKVGADTRVRLHW